MMNRGKDRKRKRVDSFFSENKRVRLNNPPVLTEVMIEPSEPPILPSDNKRYDQVPMISKINAYFSECGEPPIDDEGQCYGMAIAWLQKMIEGNVAWFYHTRDAIIMFPVSHMHAIDEDVRQFAKLIDKAQNIKKYIPDAKYQSPDLFFKTNSIVKCKINGAPNDLAKHFHNLRSVVMYLVNCADHTIAIYQSDGVYHLFDSNYLDGEAKIIDDRNKLPAELIESFYGTFGDPVPEQLTLDITLIRDAKALRYVAPPKSECDDNMILVNENNEQTLEAASPSCAIL